MGSINQDLGKELIKHLDKEVWQTAYQIYTKDKKKDKLLWKTFRSYYQNLTFLVEDNKIDIFIKKGIKNNTYYYRRKND